MINHTSLPIYYVNTCTCMNTMCREYKKDVYLKKLYNKLCYRENALFIFKYY